MTEGNPPLPAWEAKQLRRAIDAAGVALWSWNVDDDQLTMAERAFALWIVTDITSRSTTTAAEMARELTQRLTALGRAHDLVMPQRPRSIIADSQAWMLSLVESKSLPIACERSPCLWIGLKLVCLFRTSRSGKCLQPSLHLRNVIPDLRGCDGCLGRSPKISIIRSYSPGLDIRFAASPPSMPQNPDRI